MSGSAKVKLNSLIFICLALLLVPVTTGCQQETEQVDTARSGGNLNLYNIDPITLDPALSRDMTSHEYVVQIYSGLLRLDDKLQPVADIAREWDISRDGLVYTFRLRDDVTFHSGRPLTANDVKYSLERACDPVTGSQTAATYLGDIVGVTEKLAGRASSLQGVQVLDEHTVQITIDSPKTYFLAKLTYSTAMVVDMENVADGDSWWQKPVGTGPFRLKEWRQRELLTLERNDAYHGHVPYLKEVRFHLWVGLPMNLYETDEIDVTGFSMINIDRVTDPRGQFHDQVTVSPELSLGYIGFDVTRPPFDDSQVRRAFSLSLDRQKITSLVFRDMVQPAAGILPAGLPGYNEAIADIPFDPEAALKLVKESSYGSVENLPPIVITTSGYGGVASSGLEAIISEWRSNLGVEMTVRQLEPERFFYVLNEEKDNMYLTGWVADYPHPQNFLDVLFRTGEDNNQGEYSNPEVDRLLASAAAETDDQASMALYRQAEELIMGDSACIPLWFGRNHVLVKPHVNGYSLNAMGIADLSKVWLE